MNPRFSVTVCLIWISVSMTGCGAGVPQETLPPGLPAPTQTPTPDISATSTLPPTAAPTAKLLPISPEASAYLEEALAILQTHSLYRESTNWEEIRRSVFEVARHAQTPADTYGAIRHALVRLGDHHSSLFTPADVEQLGQQTELDNPAPRGKLLLDGIGFIAIEGYMAFEGDQYATDAHQLIRELDVQGVCGWVVDLRENTGGNMGPMLAAIGPILGEGEVGAFIDSYGKKELWYYRDGQSLVGEDVYSRVLGEAYTLKTDFPPVAVLTGVNTASAGEVIVVAFRGRPNARSFGLYTTGLSTANRGFPLSDRAVINLTTSVYADRTGQTYGERIYPDEIVDDVSQFEFLMEEAIPQPAIDWLQSQPACSAGS